MSIYLNRKENRSKKIIRIRKKVSGTNERPRVSVFKSNRYFYVQIINDLTGNVLLSFSTRDKDFIAKSEKVKPIEQAKRLGLVVSEKCKEKSIETVVFDRRGYKYHGIIKAFADAMREGGIKF